MSETELPAGWVWAELGEVAEVSGGIQKQQKRRPVRNMFPFLRVANVGRGRLDLSEIHQIELFDGELERFRLKYGDLLVVEGNGSPEQIGRAATWLDQIPNAVHQNHLIRVRPTEALTYRYLELIWNSPLVAEQLRKVAASTSGLYTLNTAKLKRVRLPFPAAPEQNRIVEALEDHLSRLDAATKLTTASQARLRHLSDATLQKILDRCKTFPSEALGDLLSEPLRNGHSARATNTDGVRTLTLTAVTLGDFSEKHTKLTSADPARVSNLWLEPGDILVQRSNTPDLVGTSALYFGPRNWAIFPDLLIRVRVDSRLLPEFGSLILASKKTRNYFRASAKGLAGSMPKIDQATIEAVRVPVPPLNVQKEIVAEAGEASDQVRRLTKQLDRTAKQARALRVALFRKAFSGDLVSQDPTDEPASDLLTRIQAERDSRPKRTRRTSPPKPTATDVPPPPAPSTPLPQIAIQQEFEL